MFHGRRIGIIGILTYSDYFQPLFLNTCCPFVGEKKVVNSTCDILPHPKVHWYTLQLRVFDCVGCRHTCNAEPFLRTAVPTLEAQ